MSGRERPSSSNLQSLKLFSAKEVFPDILDAVIGQVVWDVHLKVSFLLHYAPLGVKKIPLSFKSHAIDFLHVVG